MRIDEHEGTIVFDNLLDADGEFGAVKSAVEAAAPAKQAKQKNALGTFEDRKITETHKRAVEFAKRIKENFAS